jgi:non-canonical purine NTP pyrophosphatase (RdgB/HAM1 family)
VRLVLATRNQDKAGEIAAILRGAPAELVSLAEFPSAPDVEETGDTLEKNALLKAESAARHCALAAVADDSGLFVDALDGAPGVHSARYAGTERSYARNNAKLLAELGALPPGKRTARFECVVALVVPGKAPLFFKGTLPGRIVEAPRGENGFGYDPLFQPDGTEVTLAELAAEEKNAISHRFVAFQRLKDFLLAARTGSGG